MTKGISKRLSWLIVLTMIVSILAIVPGRQLKAAVDFEAMPIPTLDTYQNGYRIAKTMHLLETSTAENPNTVRIAVTGQSISDGNNPWVPQLIDYLRERYPTANIEFQNFAIGGFSSQLLYKRVPNDMASFFPDLVILYVYGDHTKYDRIVKHIRENIGAEVLMQTDHYTGPSDWSDTMSYTLLPQIADKYGAELCRLREPWKKYLEDNSLQPSAMLRDDVHLNDDGQKFMLELMKQFFVYRPSNAAEAIESEYIEVKPSDWVDGKLTIPFHGTRAEVVPGSGQQHAANVKVDGKKPSEVKESYMTSREPKGISTYLGIIGFNDVPQEQRWTLELTKYVNAEDFEVKASGSKTGDEGTSVNSVLDGKHIRVDHESFIFTFSSPAVGKKYTFDTILNGTDTYIKDKNVLFSGLEIKDHTLELEAVDPSKIPDIKAIRIFDPSVTVQADEAIPTTKPSVKPTPRTNWVDNGDFEGGFTENMFNSGLDIPNGWNFWGNSSMSYVANQGVGGSGAGKIVKATGSKSVVEIPAEFLGRKFKFTGKVKLLTPADSPTSGLTVKLHAESKKQITFGDKTETQNYEVPSEKKFVITNNLFGDSTDFVEITGEIGAPDANEVVDQNGDAFTPVFLSFQMWNDGSGGEYLLDDLSLEVLEKVADPTPEPTPELEKLPKPNSKVKKIDSSTKKINGSFGENGAVITLYRGKKELANTTVKNKKFTLKFSKQARGAKLKLVASKEGFKDSNASTYTVALQKAKVKKAKNRVVKGVAYKKAQVTVLFKGKNIGRKKANAKGKFNIKLKRKLKKGNNIVIRCKSGKFTSKVKFKVK